MRSSNESFINDLKSKGYDKLNIIANPNRPLQYEKGLPDSEIKYYLLFDENIPEGEEDIDSDTYNEMEEDYMNNLQSIINDYTNNKFANLDVEIEGTSTGGWFVATYGDTNRTMDFTIGDNKGFFDPLYIIYNLLTFCRDADNAEWEEATKDMRFNIEEDEEMGYILVEFSKNGKTLSETAEKLVEIHNDVDNFTQIFVSGKECAEVLSIETGADYDPENEEEIEVNGRTVKVFDFNS